MKCKQIRLLLAVSPREWSAAERALVEAHLAACPRCAELAREYVSQERRIASLPRPGLSPEREEAVLARVRREAGWLRWRMRLSNALAMAAGVLLALFLGLTVSALPRRALIAVTPPTATPELWSVATTPAPTAAPRSTPPANHRSTDPLILVDNGPRSGMSPPEPYAHRDLYTILGQGDYRLRYRFDTEGMEPMSRLESPPLTAEELDGVALLIVPWTSCYAAGGNAGGRMVTYDFNLTVEEAKVVREYVAGGGQALFVLDPTYQCDFGALSLLGIEAEVTRAVVWDDEGFHSAEGRLNNRSFLLAGQHRFQPVRSLSGEAWARLDGQDALAVEPIGQGRVVVLGLPFLVNGMRLVPPTADQGQPAPLFTADNLAFLVAVVEELTGAPSGLDVEAILWEERKGALHEGIMQLEERLSAWTPERIAWAAPHEDERQVLADQVTALRTRIAEAREQLAGLEAEPDPARYQAVRGILAEVLERVNQIEVKYAPWAYESREARQARRLRPWLLGLLAGAALLSIAAWRVRRLDRAPATWARQWAALLPFVVAALLLVVHLLAAADLIGFRLRVGGYPLHRGGVWGYAALALLATLVFFKPGVSSLTRLALPLLVSLTLMQAHLLTDLVGAEYATYRDYEGEIALMANLGVAMAFCLAGVLYRRPRWLAVMAGVHLALVFGVMGGNSLAYALRDGFEPWQVYAVALPPSPLPYLVILYTLSLLAARPVRQPTYWGVLALLLSLFVAGGTLQFILGFTWVDSSAPAFFDWLNNLILIPLLLAMGVLSGAYQWHVRRAATGRLPLITPLAATILLVGLAALIMPSLLAPSHLPESGAAMPWRSADFQVPLNAWTVLLPIARVLAASAPWLVLLTITLQVWQLMDRAQGATPSIPGRVRRWLLALAVSYALLLTGAVADEILTSPQPHWVWASPWEDPRIRVLGAGLASLLSVAGLTAWLNRRAGPGRWGGVVYGLMLAVQVPAWLLGLGRLRPLSGLSVLLTWPPGISFLPVRELVSSGLAMLALAALIGHLVIAGRVLVLREGRGDPLKSRVPPP